MADVDNVTGSLPPDLANQLDPNVLQQLMAGINESKKPATPLGGKLAEANAPDMSAPSASVPSSMPPMVQQAVSAMAKGMSPEAQQPQDMNQISGIANPVTGSKQADIQQKRQQDFAEGFTGADALKPKPVIFDLINAITGKNIGGNKDASNVPGYQPPSKLDHFNNFLTNFMQSLAAGFANEGTGPGAAFRGAGAAMQAPYQQSVQRFGIEQQARQQEAAIDLEKQKVAAMTPSIDVVGPKGEGLRISPSQLPQYLSAGYRFKGQEVAAEAGIKKAEIQAQNKLEVEALKTHLLQGTASKFVPDAEPGPNGRRFYHVYNRFGKEIGQADVNAIPQFMGKTTSTYELKQREDGSFMRIPKVTQNEPIIPNKGSSTPGAGGVPAASVNKGGKTYWGTSDASGGADRMAAIPVLDSSGNPVFGKAPENIRTMAYTADATLPHIPEILKEIDELDKMGVLGQFKGKGTDFLTKKGFAVPGLTAEQRQAVGKFIDDVKLMDSAMLRTHFGARGGQQMYDKFSEMLNAGEDVDLMKGGLNSFSGFLTGYSDMINQQTNKAARRNIPTPSSQPSQPKGGGNRPPGW